MATLQRKLPFGPEKLVPFTEELFDREERKAARILWSILETQSPRRSDWRQVFSDSSEGANYRTIDRVLPKLDAETALMRLYDPESPFVLVDPTEIERKSRPKTPNTWVAFRMARLWGSGRSFSPSLTGVGRSPSTSGCTRRRRSTSKPRVATFRGALRCGR